MAGLMNAFQSGGLWFGLKALRNTVALRKSWKCARCDIQSKMVSKVAGGRGGATGGGTPIGSLTRLSTTLVRREGSGQAADDL